jgi:hypothetical protein
LDEWWIDECNVFIPSCPCATQGGEHRLTRFLPVLDPHAPTNSHLPISNSITYLCTKKAYSLP